MFLWKVRGAKIRRKWQALLKTFTCLRAVNLHGPSHVVSSESEVREIDPVNAKDCGLSLERMQLQGGAGVGCGERGSLIQSMHHLNEVFQSSDGGINWRSPPKGRHFE